MALNIEQVPWQPRLIGSEKVIEPNIIEGRRRLKRRDVATQGGIFDIRAHHHRHGIPANEAANISFNKKIARHPGFFVCGDRISIWGCDGVG